MTVRNLLSVLVTVGGLISCDFNESTSSETPKIETNGEIVQNFDKNDTMHALYDASDTISIEIPLNENDTLYSIKSAWIDNSKKEPTKIPFKNFEIKINSFFWTEMLSSDTIAIFEDVGEYLSGQKIEILPKNNQDTFHLYVRTINNIFEMMDSDSLGLIEDFETWEQFRYEDTSKSYYWKPLTTNKYIFPNLDLITSQKMEELYFEDTTYWYHGEMSGTFFGHAYLYSGHIVDYYIYHAFITIERHNNGLKETKVLKVEFSYGC